VEQLKKETPSPVLLYKPQGIDDPDMPLLVLMTDLQA